MKTTTAIAWMLLPFALVGPAGCATAPMPASDVLTGRYAGTLPCADCEGIRVVLELYEETADGPPTRYTLERTYLGMQEGDSHFIEVGEWAILRGDRELVLLDRDLAEIESDQPDTLTRTL